MAKKVKFLREYNKFRKHKEYVVAENVALYFLNNSFAELVEDIVVTKEPCEDCPDDCEDCKGKNKKTPKKESKPKSKKKKAPKKK